MFISNFMLYLEQVR